MSSNFSEASVSFPQPTPLRPISLPLLMLQGGELRLEVHQPFPELEDSEPVQGWIQLRHRGSCLEVEGEASTQVLCRCDRCLRPFHLPLRTQAHELLAVGPVGAAEGQADLNAELLQDSWLNENGRVDLEALLGEDPEERLDPQGAFDPEHWLFQLLSLQLPLVYRCGPDCPGPDRWTSDSGDQDPRWAALRQLRDGGA